MLKAFTRWMKLATLLVVAITSAGCSRLYRIAVTNHLGVPCSVDIYWTESAEVAAAKPTNLNDWRTVTMQVAPGERSDEGVWFHRCDTCIVEVVSATGQRFSETYSYEGLKNNTKNTLGITYFVVDDNGLSFSRPQIWDYINRPEAFFQFFCCFLPILLLPIWWVRKWKRINMAETNV